MSSSSDLRFRTPAKSSEETDEKSYGDDNIPKVLFQTPASSSSLSPGSTASPPSHRKSTDNPFDLGPVWQYKKYEDNAEIAFRTNDIGYPIYSAYWHRDNKVFIGGGGGSRGTGVRSAVTVYSVQKEGPKGPDDADNDGWIRTAMGEINADDNLVTHLSMDAASGRELYISSGNSCTVFNISTGFISITRQAQFRTDFSEEEEATCVVDPSGSLLACAGGDKVVSLYRIKYDHQAAAASPSRRKIAYERVLKLVHPNSIRSLSFNKKGTKLLTVSHDAVCRIWRIPLWARDHRSASGRANRSNSSSSNNNKNKDNENSNTCSKEDTGMEDDDDDDDTASENGRRFENTETDVDEYAHAGTSAAAAVTAAAGRVVVEDTPWQEVKVPKPGEVRCARFIRKYSPSDQKYQDYVITGINKSLRGPSYLCKWDPRQMEKGPLNQRYIGALPVQIMEVSHDGKLISVVTQKNDIITFTAEDLSYLCEASDLHGFTVTAICFSPDSASVLSVGADRGIRFHGLRSSGWCSWISLNWTLLVVHVILVLLLTIIIQHTTAKHSGSTAGGPPAVQKLLRTIQTTVEDWWA